MPSFLAENFDMMVLIIPLQAIHGAMSQSVLEEAKAHFQEQLLRKAAQKEADAAMDEEQKRCACACKYVYSIVRIETFA